jgi:hypothetical protein
MCAQLAYYVDGYEIAEGKRLPATLVAVEKNPPFVVQVYQLTDEHLQLGRETYRQWLDQLRVCRDESRWPGFMDGPMILQLPKWAMNEEEDSGEDLTFGGKEEA